MSCASSPIRRNLPALACLARVLCLGLLVATTHPLPASDARTWTDVNGRTLEAVLLSGTTDSIRIRHTSDNQEFTIPIAQFSEADRAEVTFRGQAQPWQQTRLTEYKEFAGLLRTALADFRRNDISFFFTIQIV